MSSKVQEKEQEVFVGAKELAKSWRTTQTTVRRVLRDRGVKAFRFSGKPGGLVRYRKEDVERLMAESVEA